MLLIDRRPTRQILFPVLVVLTFHLASSPMVADPSALNPAEVQKLVGTWEGYAVEGTGENPNRGPVHLRLTITAEKMRATDLGKENRDMGNGTFSVKTTGTIKELDAKGIVLPGRRERTFLGIYEIQGDTLRWCVDNRQQGRPTEFRTGGGNFLLILKRKK